MPWQKLLCVFWRVPLCFFEFLEKKRLVNKSVTTLPDDTPLDLGEAYVPL